MALLWLFRVIRMKYIGICSFCFSVHSFFASFPLSLWISAFCFMLLTVATKTVRRDSFQDIHNIDN